MSVSNLLGSDRQTWKEPNVENLIVQENIVASNIDTNSISVVNAVVEDLTFSFIHPPVVFPSSYIFTNSGGNLGNNNYERWGSEGTETASQVVMPVNVVLSNLYVRLTTAPGGTTRRTFTVRVNGVNTSLVVFLTGTETQKVNTVNTVNVAAGSLVSILHTTTGNPANSNGKTSLKIN